MKADIRNLDLNLLKTLDALLDERSVTRAATRLSLTQPAVSGMLTRLREAFNDPLFIRAPHGMVPTLRAQALASPVNLWAVLKTVAYTWTQQDVSTEAKRSGETSSLQLDGFWWRQGPSAPLRSGRDDDIPIGFRAGAGCPSAWR